VTESEWLLVESVVPLRAWIEKHRKKSLRKMRLFSGACCRRLWDHLPDERSRDAIEAAEKYADGEIDKKALGRARVAAMCAARKAPTPQHGTGPMWTAADAAQILANLPVRDNFIACTGRCAIATANLGLRTQPEEEREQANILRDIFGNPFQPITFAPSWRTDTAVALAEQMYESRDFGAMPILADALQDAGCDNEEILAHCRGDGPHVRGCWVTDLVLGKE
jgi:hypothetical protein